jgi:hypothetical protein
MAALRFPKYDLGYISPNKINLGSPILNLLLGTSSSTENLSASTCGQEIRTISEVGV